MSDGDDDDDDDETGDTASEDGVGDGLSGDEGTASILAPIFSS